MQHACCTTVETLWLRDTELSEWSYSDIKLASWEYIYWCMSSRNIANILTPDPTLQAPLLYWQLWWLSYHGGGSWRFLRVWVGSWRNNGSYHYRLCHFGVHLVVCLLPERLGTVIPYHAKAECDDDGNGFWLGRYSDDDDDLGDFWRLERAFEALADKGTNDHGQITLEPSQSLFLIFSLRILLELLLRELKENSFW